MAAIFLVRSRQNEEFLQRTSHTLFVPTNKLFGLVGSEEIFKALANHNQELTVAAMFFDGSKGNEDFQQMTS